AREDVRPLRLDRVDDLLAVGDELEAHELAAAALSLAAAPDRARAAIVPADGAPGALAPALRGGAVRAVRRRLLVAGRATGPARRARPSAAAPAAPRAHPRDPLSGRPAAAGRRARSGPSARPCRRPSAAGGCPCGRRRGRPPPPRAHAPAPRGRPCA